MNRAAAQNAPRRSLIWDEANACYIWLDPRERAVAASIRSNRLAFQSREIPPASTASVLADLYVSDDYDAQCRHNSRSRAASKRRTEDRQATAKPRKRNIAHVAVFVEAAVAALIAI